MNTEQVKAKIKEYRDKVLFGFLSAGKSPCTFAYNQSLAANGTGTFTIPVPQSFIFVPQYIAVKSTGEFQITSIQINQQNLHYGDPISSLIFSQYNAFPLQWNALIPNNTNLVINIKDVSGAINAVKILTTGYSLPA